MEIMMIIIVISIVTIVLLKILLNINFKSIKNLDMGSTEELKNIAQKLEKDKEMCNSILDIVECSKGVNIKIDSVYNNCLYTVFNNTIVIGNFKEEYMKPQTIAHECIHASQSKRILWSNFIISNIYLIYFAIITILALINKLPHVNIHMLIFIFLSIIQYIIRAILENEAMLKAKFVAKEYLEKNKKITKKEEEILINEYERVNKIGIPFMNYYLISMNIVKIVIFAFLCLT